MADGVVEIDVELDESKAISEGRKLGGDLAKIGAASAAAFGAATGALVKQALDLYASYEQLAGGVETLFGDEAAAKVSANAAAAFETAGMSANQYMETVTSFSASLINSLGGDTAAAAEYADLAIRDMADNANKMGTSIEVIQDTYASLARGNYAMLDNLKLGFGGTKEGLEELMEAAEKYQASQGNMVDYSIDSYADIVQAIHDVQVAQGLAGATAAEAATTIEGSVNTMKAAWENWLTGLGNSDADMADLTKKLSDSLVTAAKNIIPRIGVIVTALVGSLASSIPSALGDIAEQVMPFVYDLIDTVLTAAPQMAAAGIGLVSNMVLGMLDQLPRLISTFASALVRDGIPMLLSSVTNVVTGIVNALPRIIGNIVDAIPGIIADVVWGIVDSIPMLVEGFVQLFTAFTVAIPEIIAMLAEELPQIIDTIVDAVAENAPVLLAAAFELFMAILKGLWEAAPSILSALGELLGNLLAKAAELPGKMLEIGADVVRGLWDGISGMFDWVMDKIAGFADGIVGGIKDFFGISSPSKVMREQVGRYLAEGVGVGFEKYSPIKGIQSSLTAGLSSFTLAASAAGGPTTNYFTIERIDAHDMAGVNNVQQLISLFERNR